MSAKNKYILATAAFFLVIYFVAIPLMNRQKAASTARALFGYWLENDAVTALKFFSDIKKFPPIYDLKSYKIVKVKMGRVNGRLLARFYVTLEFPPNNPMPSGKVWVCELEKFSRGWQDADFYLSQE